MDIKINIIGKATPYSDFLTFTCRLHRLKTGTLVWKIEGPHNPTLPILNKKQIAETNDMCTFSYFPYEEGDF